MNDGIYLFCGFWFIVVALAFLMVRANLRRQNPPMQFTKPEAPAPRKADIKSTSIVYDSHHHIYPN